MRLLEFDSGIRGAGPALVGTDEVGRGCLAGPVVAAAVRMTALAPNSLLYTQLSLLDDSKKLSGQTREKLAEVIEGNFEYAIGLGSIEEIERLNILHASLLAMRRALETLGIKSHETILVDGNRKVPSVAGLQSCIVKGDSTSAVVAAASVVAKVFRDRLMIDLSRQFPQYGWDSNKGYGSPAHRQAIADNGLSAHHRKSFCKDLICPPPRQLTLSAAAIVGGLPGDSQALDN